MILDDFRIYFKKNFLYQNTNDEVISIDNLDKHNFSCKNNTEKFLSLLFINSMNTAEEMVKVQENDENEVNFFYFSNGFYDAVSLIY